MYGNVKIKKCFGGNTPGPPLQGGGVGGRGGVGGVGGRGEGGDGEGKGGEGRGRGRFCHTPSEIFLIRALYRTVFPVVFLCCLTPET